MTTAGEAAAPADGAAAAAAGATATAGPERGASTAHCHIGAGHPAFDGHFPGRPILPGVALLAEVMEAIAAEPALAAAVGPAPRLAFVKFAHGVAPETTLTLRIDTGASAIAFSVLDPQSRVAASGSFGPMAAAS